MTKFSEKYFSVEFTNVSSFKTLGIDFSMFFKTTKSLKGFHIPDSEIETDELKDILEGIRANSSLEVLTLKKEVTNIEELREISETLKAHPSLKEFVLIRDDISVNVEELFSDAPFKFESRKLNTKSE